MPPLATETLSIRDLLRKQFPPGQYVIGNGLLNRGSKLVIGGAPKAYKSLITSTIMINIATGTPAFGATRSVGGDRREPMLRVDEPRTILYLEQEIGEQDLQQRLCCQLSQLPLEHRDMALDLITVRSCDRDLRLDTMIGKRAIREVILEAGSPDVVIFDPLVEFHEADENSASEMMAVLHNLDSLQSEFGFSCIVNHHTSKATDNGRNGPDRLRGSSVLFGKADAIMLLDPDGKQKGLVKAEFTLRRAKPLDDLWLTVDEFSLSARFVCWGHSPELKDGRGREKKPGASLVKAAKVQ